MGEDGELDEDWRRRGGSAMDLDWGLTGFSEPSRWPSDAGRREIWEGRQEDQSFVGEGGGQKESRGMAGKVTVT